MMADLDTSYESGQTVIVFFLQTITLVLNFIILLSYALVSTMMWLMGLKSALSDLDYVEASLEEATVEVTSFSDLLHSW
jgi:hypothetical protein